MNPTFNLSAADAAPVAKTIARDNTIKLMSFFTVSSFCLTSLNLFAVLVVVPPTSSAKRWRLFMPYLSGANGWPIQAGVLTLVKVLLPEMIINTMIVTR